MSDIDVDLSGLAELQEGLENLQDRGESERVYEVSSNARYSAPLEFGRGPIEAQDAEALRFRDSDGNVIYRTSVSGHPPYPFFRPALRELESNIERFVKENQGVDIREVPSTDKLLLAIASSLESQIKRNANANQGGRSPGTHPDHPVTRTSNLVNSIRFNRLK